MIRRGQSWGPGTLRGVLAGTWLKCVAAYDIEGEPRNFTRLSRACDLRRARNDCFRQSELSLSRVLLLDRINSSELPGRGNKLEQVAGAC